MNHKINVVATTISGSIKDWGKVKRIVPLFHQHGETDVSLYTVDSHADARRITSDLIRSGHNIVISAGGSGTFNAVLEGCFDSGKNLSEVRLGFLRKGSADLIGKVLGMPDDIEQAISVFVKSIREDRIVPCDVIRAASEGGDSPARRFIGYGGGELFGRIPHYTENRFVKYYKGLLSQAFGDLGPFFVGTSLTIIEKFLKSMVRKKHSWKIIIDDEPISQGFFQAIIIVNGDLGQDLPFARSQPLGSGKFYLFTIRDLGAIKLMGQLKHAWDSSIMEEPQKYGFESFCVEKKLVLEPDGPDVFPINVDGSNLDCRHSASFEICDKIHLFSK